jgi:hypothetical protein
MVLMHRCVDDESVDRATSNHRKKQKKSHETRAINVIDLNQADFFDLDYLKCEKDNFINHLRPKSSLGKEEKLPSINAEIAEIKVRGRSYSSVARVRKKENNFNGFEKQRSSAPEPFLKETARISYCESLSGRKKTIQREEPVALPILAFSDCTTKLEYAKDDIVLKQSRKSQVTASLSSRYTRKRANSYVPPSIPYSILKKAQQEMIPLVAPPDASNEPEKVFIVTSPKKISPSSAATSPTKAVPLTLAPPPYQQDPLSWEKTMETNKERVSEYLRQSELLVQLLHEKSREMKEVNEIFEFVKPTSALQDGSTSMYDYRRKL